MATYTYPLADAFDLNTHNIYGSVTVNQNYESNPGNDQYPDPTQESVFGPILAPRIYGSNLDMFEIASSGKIGVTLDDTYVFDLSYSNNLVTYETVNSNDSLKFYSSNDLTVYAKDNLNLTAEGAINFSAPNFDFAASNFILDMSSNIYIHANCNIFVGQSDPGTMDSNDQLPQNIYIQSDLLIDIETTSFDVLATDGATMTSSNDFTITSINSNVEIAATSGVIDLDAKTFTLDTTETSTITSGGTYTVNTSNEIVMGASNDFTITSVDSNVEIAATSGVIALDAKTYTLDTTETSTIKSVGTYTVNTSNDIDMSASNNINTTAGSNVSTTAASGNIIHTISTDSNKFDVVIGNKSTFTVEKDVVTISSNLNVYGVINSVGITNTNLEIEDVVLQLGYDSNTPGGYSNHGFGSTGVFADGAGIEIMNLPGGSNFGTSNWEKHIKWFEPTESVGLSENSGYSGKQSVDNEAKWELQGGALHLVSPTVKYSIRIGTNDQLEFHKSVFNNTSNVYEDFKKVAVFGR
jgi:hypothetical protein